MKLLRRVLGDSATHFGLAWYGALALNLVQGVLFARILGPERYGVWMALQLMLTYGIYYHLGLLNALSRQIPLALGRDDPARAHRLAEAGSGALAGITVVWLAMATVVGLLIYREHRIGALVFVGCTAVEVWFNHASYLLKAHSSFGKVGLLSVGRAALNFLLLPLVAWHGLPGAYERIVVVTLLACLAAWRLFPHRPRPRWDRATTGFLLDDGLPILLVGVVFSFQTTVDRLLVAALLDTTSLGLYGVAAFLMTFMMVIPGAVGQTSYPKMLRRFGANGLAHELRPSVLRQTALAGGLALVAIVAVGLLLPRLVEVAMPRFTPGITPARWLLPATFFVSLAMPSSYLLQTIRRQRLHLLLSLVALLVQAALIMLAARSGRGLVGVAQASSLGLLLHAGLTVGAALLYTRRPRAHMQS